MIVCADVMDWAASYKGPKFHALLCDSPYYLTSIVERFGKPNSAPAQQGKDGAFKRLSTGFMGSQWDGVGEDGQGIAMKGETWSAIAEHLYPGAFLFVFAGCLNDDLISQGMRDAGLVKFSSLYWVFGSGFPKATRVPDKRFSGHRYGRQCIKPAVETILCFRKPYEGRPVDCITQTGAGALNVEAGRVRGNMKTAHYGGKQLRGSDTFGQVAGNGFATEENLAGRWPSNLIIEKGDCAEALDRQSGHLTSGALKPYHEQHENASSYRMAREKTYQQDANSGGASRYFQQTDWNAEVAEAIAEAEPFKYMAKAGRVERDAGLEGLPMQSEIRINAPRESEGEKFSPSRNIHPCCKPLSLTRYLASLLLPPAEYGPRRLCVPFSGSGSECVGAHLARWEEVVGIEQSAEYCRIAEARLRFWSCNAGLFESLTAEEENPTVEQASLFDLAEARQ